MFFVFVLESPTIPEEVNHIQQDYLSDLPHKTIKKEPGWNLTFLEEASKMSRETNAHFFVVVDVETMFFSKTKLQQLCRTLPKKECLAGIVIRNSHKEFLLSDVLICSRDIIKRATNHKLYEKKPYYLRFHPDFSLTCCLQPFCKYKKLDLTPYTLFPEQQDNDGIYSLSLTSFCFARVRNEKNNDSMLRNWKLLTENEPPFSIGKNRQSVKICCVLVFLIVLLIVFFFVLIKYNHANRTESLLRQRRSTSSRI